MGELLFLSASGREGAELNAALPCLSIYTMQRCDADRLICSSVPAEHIPLGASQLLPRYRRYIGSYATA